MLSFFVHFLFVKIISHLILYGSNSHEVYPLDLLSFAFNPCETLVLIAIGNVRNPKHIDFQDIYQVNPFV